MRTSYLICYDICDDKRLRKVFQTMRGFGDHLQFSIFECQLTSTDLARCRAHRGDRKRAIAALQQAVAAGFKDAARVEQDAAFAGFRNEPSFLEVLSAMK